MLCEKCQLREGAISVKKLQNGILSEVMLCESCLKEEEQYELETPFSANHFISSIIESVQASALKVNYIKTTSCSKCGMTYGLFREIGRFGCSQCYETFEDRIDGVIVKFHGSNNHKGKTPLVNEALYELKKELNQYQLQLKEAVDIENYELAAKCRDTIQTIEEAIANVIEQL